MASIILARNPEKYGLPKDLEDPLRYDKVQVSKSIDLRAAAKLMNVSFEHLKQLNPALRGVTTPSGYSNFELHIPPGADADLHQKLAMLPAVKIAPPREASARRHKVRPNETLSRIAARYKVSVAALQRANRLKSSKSLRAGAWLTIPGNTTVARAKKGSAAKKSVSHARASSKSKLTAKSRAVKKPSGKKVAVNARNASRKTAKTAGVKSARKAGSRQVATR
jgi:membrane-bound lytic murein transglycosylase D